MSKAKTMRREGCKNAFLIGLALAAGAVNSAAAERAALVIGNAVHRAASGLSNTGSISHDRSAQKTPFATTDMERGLDRNVALGRARDVVMRMAADRREFFADVASLQRLSMEVEMKTGHQKSTKRTRNWIRRRERIPQSCFPKRVMKTRRRKNQNPPKCIGAPHRR